MTDSVTAAATAYLRDGATPRSIAGGHQKLRETAHRISAVDPAMYYYIPISADAQTSHYNAPFSPVFQFAGVIGFQDPFASVGVPNPFPARFGGTTVPGRDVTFQTPTALQVTDTNIKIPLMTTWNLTIERQFGTDWLLRAAYVGNKGTNLMTVFQNSRELNPAIYIPVRSTTANTQARRPLQDFTTITEVSLSGHNSHYNGLQLTVERHFVRGLSILANYTFAKTMDDFGWTNPSTGDLITPGRMTTSLTTSIFRAFGTCPIRT